MATTISVRIPDVNVQLGQSANLVPVVTITDASGPTIYSWIRVRRDISGDTINSPSSRNTRIDDTSITSTWNGLRRRSPFRRRGYVEFVYRLTVTNNNVNASADVTVTYRPAPPPTPTPPTTVSVLLATAATIGSGETSTVGARAVVANAVGDTTWAWRIVSGRGTLTTITDTGLTSSVRFIAQAVTASSTVVLEATATNNSVSSSARITITVTPSTAISISIPDVTVELGQVAYLTPTVVITGASGATTYSWVRVRRDISGDTINGSTTRNASVSDASITANWNALSADSPFRRRGYVEFVYRLTVTNNNVNASADVTVTYRPAPTTVAAMAGPDRAIESGETVQITGTAAVKNPVGSTSFSWRIVSGGGTILGHGQVAPYGTIDYTAPVVIVESTVTLELTATNNGVSATDRLLITVRMVPPHREAVELRYALRVHPVKDLIGWTWWNGREALTLDGVTYQPGEITGLGSYDIQWSGRNARPVEVLVDGADPRFRAWLQQGPGARTLTVSILQRTDDTSAPWVVAATFTGVCAAVTRRDDQGWSVEIDPNTESVSPRVRLVWSDESQHELRPGDRFLEGAKAIAKGVTVVWPG